MGILVKDNIVFGSTPPVDNTLDENSTNPVQNKTIFGALALKADKTEIPTYATQNVPGTVRIWTTSDGTLTTLHISTEAPTP